MDSGHLRRPLFFFAIAAFCYLVAQKKSGRLLFALPQGFASRWSAQRVRDEFPETHWAPGRPPSLTGETIYPWMFEEYPRLKPLQAAAELLAHDEQWPLLYDAERLRRNTVPVVAAIYAEDMYVPPALSERTAAAINNLRPWITNEYEHSGLRDDERVFTRLVAMQREVV